MGQIPKTKLDVTKITGPYPLLGAFLLITEGLLGFWFFRADEATERMVVGGLMTVIFLVFLYVVMRIATKVEQAAAPGQAPPKRRWRWVVATVAVLAFIGALSEEFDPAESWESGYSEGFDSGAPPIVPGSDPDSLEGTSFISQSATGELSREELVDRQWALEERLRQVEGQLGTPSRNDAPRRRRAVNVSGIWQGSNGMSYVFQQNMNAVAFQERNPMFGLLTAVGEGTVQGREISVSFQSAEGVLGQAHLSLAPGGQQMSGTVQNALGITGQITLTLVERGAGAEYSP